MKKLLYILYYWPPCGGISVLRNSKFVKYFRNYGWEPIAYVPENPHYPVIDESTFRDIPPGIEVIKRPVMEPFGIFNVLQGKKADEKVQDVFLVREKEPGLVHKMGVWVRGNFFIPDARMLWIKPSVKFLTEYVQEHQIDAILSSGPPHSVHRIAYGLKKNTGLPWIADFQDPWTQIDYFEKFMLTGFARKKHYRMEREVLQSADKVTTVSHSWAKDFEKLSGRHVDTVHMGYDEDDFKDIEPKKTGKFIISHFGTLGLDRNPEKLWEVLAELGNEDPGFLKDLLIALAGVVDYTVFEEIEKHGLKENLQYFKFLKRDEVISWMKGSDVQLLLLNKGYGDYNVMGRIPAKLFEYLGSRQPVLVLGEKESDVAKIVRETEAGAITAYEDKDELKNIISGFYLAWKEGKKLYTSQNIERYSFRQLTGQMSLLLHEITNKE